MTFTPDLITAAAQDTGDRSMQAAGRSKWSSADHRASIAEHIRLSLIAGFIPPRFRRRERTRLRALLAA